MTLPSLWSTRRDRAADISTSASRQKSGCSSKLVRVVMCMRADALLTTSIGG
jgi:hypothetical protein